MSYRQTGTKLSTDRGQHTFARIPTTEIQRSVFNRSCGRKTTFNAGQLTPIFVDEALPGDTFEMRLTAFGRLSTMINPIMDNLYLDTFFFFVPNRLLWDNWEKMNGAQTNPGDSTTFLVPQVTTPAGGYGEGTLADYFGIPILINGMQNVSALPFRAYNLIWNEWFRDQNLQNSLTVNTGNGPDASTDYVIKRRGKRHDYFTSCLPFAQKGTPISLPLGTSAPVTGTIIGVIPGDAASYSLGGDPGTSQANWGTPPTTPAVIGGPAGAYSGPAAISGLTANLAAATAATINQLREAFQVQRLLERDARGGTRYTEILRSHFGVVSPDQRLQRPEYLGGGTVMVNIDAIAATATTIDTGVPVIEPGNLGGVGTFGRSNIHWKQSFTEHGIIIGLCHLRADLNYQQGLNRMWSRRTRYDFYWPALAHLGEQAVLNKEIWMKNDGQDDAVFGYQERWAEYRYKPSEITGKLRSDSATPLDSWHLAQDFNTRPALNDTFIQDTPPMSRVVAVTDSAQPNALADFFFDYKCARPMPVFSVPGLIDHF